MKRISLFTIVLATVVFSLGTYSFAAPIREPRLAVSVDHAILRFGDDSKGPCKTALSVKPLNFPEGAALVYEWKQVQDEMVPGAAKMAEKPIQFSDSHRPSVTATFPASGVYEVQVTVTDRGHKLSATRNTWINVWDNSPALTVGGSADPLTAIPGMAAPKVRNVMPEPGPFIHPRLLCSPEDWKAIHTRAVDGQGKIAAAAWKTLTQKYKQGVDPNGNHGKFLAEVERYLDSGGAGACPDLTMGWKDPNGIDRYLAGLFENLSRACFKQWLKVDPAQAEESIPAEDRQLCRKLAKQVAGVCRFLLQNSWDRKTGQFKKETVGYIRNLESPGERVSDGYSALALAYDFSAPWMTEAELRDTRDFIIAVGRGRTGPGMGPGHSSPENRNVSRGFEQNGTFGVWGEPMIWLSLVVSGEESAADPQVVQTFLNPPKPKDYEKLRVSAGYDLVRPVDFESGSPLRIGRPYPAASGWPHALKCDVNWLQKEIWTYQDGMISPWGFTIERLAYFGYMTNETWPVAYTFARFGGFNQYVGCYFYQTVNNWIYTLYPSGGPDRSDSFLSNVGFYEHHSGGGDYRQQYILFLKHMFPEDPVVDYAYAAQAPYFEKRSFNPIHNCIFGVDPAIKNLEEALEPAAKAGDLPLTKVDPQLGIAVMRSGWKDDDLLLYFDGGHPLWGHMNAEHGSFSLFALGRHWSVPSGYHKVLGNFQSLVQVQNPAWAACPMTHGYMTENPCFKPDVPGCDYNGAFPTPSAHLLEVRQAPDKHWSLAASDITVCYNYTCGNPNRQPVEFNIHDFMYPGLLKFLNRVDPKYGEWTKVSFYPVPDGCKIKRAIRTVLFVQGKRPYCLVVDDFQKSDSPSNYRWVMNDKTKLREEGRAADNKDESFCVVMAPGATSTEAVLLHRRDEGDLPGLPRLLVRDVSENDNSRQSAARMEQTVFKLPEEKYSREETNALVMERNEVVEPRFKVLLFPFRTGEKAPLTSWNPEKTQLTVDFQDGTSDTIVFDRSNPDRRTRLSLK